MKKLNKKLRFAVAALGAVALGGLATSTALYCMESARIAYAEDSLISSSSSSASLEGYPSHVSNPLMSLELVDVPTGGGLTIDVVKLSMSFSVYNWQNDLFNGYWDNDDIDEIHMSEITVESPHTEYAYDVVDSFSYYSLGNNDFVNFRITMRYGGLSEDWESLYDNFLEANMVSIVMYRDAQSITLQTSSLSTNTFYAYDTNPVSTRYLLNTYAPVNVGGTDIVTSIATWLTAGLNEMGAGIGAGASSFVQSLAMNGNSLSVYFIMVCAFGGIALACGLTTKIFNWLSNLGA